MILEEVVDNLTFVPLNIKFILHKQTKGMELIKSLLDAILALLVGVAGVQNS